MTRYQTDLLDLRLGDCMDLMRDTPDGFYDLAIVDPPYGIGAGDDVARHGFKHNRKEWDASPPPPEYFSELRRVARNQIVWGANHFIERLPINSPCWIIWDKQQPHDFTLAAGELAWTSFGSPCKKYVGRPMQPGRIHPTQKPRELYDWTLANYAKPGQRILDTHLGSGSHAIACHYFGAHLTATEIDPDYYAAACERVERETRQIELPLAAVASPAVQNDLL